MHSLRYPRIELLDILEPSTDIEHRTFLDGCAGDLVAPQSTPYYKIRNSEIIANDMGSKRQMRVQLKQGTFDSLEVCWKEGR